MKKILYILTVLFFILTFCGAAYVLVRKGEVNAGHAVIPMLGMITCLAALRNRK